ncbi:18904_t:CDS:1 [Racocetra persica]|uniref:18904_t:CDS:1 n=1 Tax=Racocetra persica TaxID=160502 RepID=A0ACA9KGC6_9GLOM|nr:18904_t:CDS:1 [Racocetra persica]
MSHFKHLILLVLTLSFLVLNAYPFHDENTDLDDAELTDLSPGPQSDDALSYLSTESTDLEGVPTVTAEEFKPQLEKLVKTSDHLFGQTHHKFKVMMLPITKGFHYVYKVMVFPKFKLGKPKVYDVYVTPLKKKKCFKIVSIPRHAPNNWKEATVCIPHSSN